MPAPPRQAVGTGRKSTPADATQWQGSRLGTAPTIDCPPSAVVMHRFGAPVDIDGSAATETALSTIATDNACSARRLLPFSASRVARVFAFVDAGRKERERMSIQA